MTSYFDQRQERLARLYDADTLDYLAVQDLEREVVSDCVVALMGWWFLRPDLRGGLLPLMRETHRVLTTTLHDALPDDVADRYPISPRAMADDVSQFRALTALCLDDLHTVFHAVAHLTDEEDGSRLTTSDKPPSLVARLVTVFFSLNLDPPQPAPALVVRCLGCDGHGQVTAFDPDTDADDQPQTCATCRGTGVDPCCWPCNPWSLP